MFILKTFLKRNLTLRANRLYVAQASLSVKKKFRKFYVRDCFDKRKFIQLLNRKLERVLLLLFLLIFVLIKVILLCTLTAT